MDAVSDPTVTTVVVMSSAQCGKTEVLNNIVGFHIAQDPAPILILQPTLEMGESWSKDRLAPMLRDTPALRGKIKDPRSRDSGTTITHKQFAGGHLTIAGANSPAGLASRPIRIVLCDEVDRYPASAGSEGDPVSLARKRTATFWNRKLILTSTPTVRGGSRIEMAFNESDQRRYWIPCPHCAEMQTLKWSSVRWPANEPEKAAYYCEACGAAWTDAQRYAAIRHGEWRASANFTGVAGFHLCELYSPWSRIADIARAFVDAKKSPETLKTWVNTSLGETWEDVGETVDETGLAERAEDWDENAIPAGVKVITVGIDCQNDRLECEVVGWGNDEESWSLEYSRMFGDPSAPQIWAQLDEYLLRKFRREDGAELRITAACIDSGGHHTQAVYRFARERFNRRVYAIKGMAGPGRPVWPRKASRNNTGRVNLFLIGVDSAKDAVYARLRISRPGPGFCHFPVTRDSDWYAQLTAETVTTRYSKGFPVRQWVKKAGARNEALDARVYAYAALQSLAVVWSRFRDVIPPTVREEEPATEPPASASPPYAGPAAHPITQTPRPPQPIRRPRGGGWINSWR